MSAQQQGEHGAEELERERAAYEEQLSRITSAEMALQAAISLLSIGGRRLGPPPGSSAASASAGPAAQTSGGEPGATGASGAAAGADGRDLEQVRDAIDAVMGLMPILERRMPEELSPVRSALSQLQFAYARESRAGAEDAAGTRPASTNEGSGAGTPPEGSTAPGGGSGAEGERPAAPRDGRGGPGPAESSGRLWVPGR